MKKFILIILIILGISFLFVKYVSKEVQDSKTIAPKQVVHKVLQHDGGEGINFTTAVEHNNTFGSLVNDTLGHTPDKSVKNEIDSQIQGTINSFKNSIKPNQVLPKMN